MAIEDTVAAPTAQIRSGLHGLDEEALARPAQPDARGPLCPHKRNSLATQNRDGESVEFRARAMQAIDFIEVENPFTRERS